MSHKLYNPKSHAPALFISCWLIQIPVKLLSDGAKITYGRLSQWCNETGQVYRSAKQLAEETGKSERAIERYLKELRDVKLIGTFHPQAGGINHFEFYDHPWMYEPINKNLVYKNDSYIAPTNVALPSDKCGGTPPTNVADINKKEIKENNISKKSGDESPSGAINTLKKYEITTPKKITSFHNAYIQKAVALLATENLTLDDYLKYLTEKCTRALLPYHSNGKERQNGFGNILGKKFILAVLDSQWED